jgi:hypothetical protein
MVFDLVSRETCFLFELGDTIHIKRINMRKLLKIKLAFSSLK